MSDREKLLIAMVDPRYEKRSKDSLMKITKLDGVDFDKLVSESRFVQLLVSPAAVLAEVFNSVDQKEGAANDVEVNQETLPETGEENIEIESAENAANVDNEVAGEPETQYYRLNPSIDITTILTGVVARIISNGGNFYGADTNVISIISAIINERPARRSPARLGTVARNYVHTRAIANATGFTQRAVINATIGGKCGWLFKCTTGYGNTKPSIALSCDFRVVAKATVLASQILNCV